MKDTLKVGLEHVHKYRVPENKTVPHLYPEAKPFQGMPTVFATGFMVGLFEWACIEAMAPHLDPGEGSVGTLVNFTHTAATPPGMEVTVHVRCTAVDGRRTVWEIEGRAGDHVTVDLRSEDFDAMLLAVGPGLPATLQDDDSGGRCDARIELRFLEDGVYRVAATTVGTNTVGVYTIRVSTEAAPPPPMPVPMVR